MNELRQVLAALQLFQEKAAKLRSLSFTKDVMSAAQKLNVSFKKVDKDKYRFVADRNGPQSESIDAFVLTFRFFIQDNEKSSFRNLASAYEYSGIPNALRSEFIEIRTSINEFLDSYPDFGVAIGEKKFLRREIMEIFIYGGLSHANDTKYELYNEFRSCAPLYAFAEWEFVSILSHILEAIGWIEELNVKTINELA